MEALKLIEEMRQQAAKEALSGRRFSQLRAAVVSLLQNPRRRQAAGRPPSPTTLFAEALT